MTKAALEFLLGSLKIRLWKLEICTMCLCGKAEVDYKRLMLLTDLNSMQAFIINAWVVSL